MSDRRLNIGVDVDGVLADFVHSYRNVCQNITGRSLPEDVADWDMTNWGLSKEEHSLAWGTLSDTQNFHTTLRPYDDVGSLAGLCIAHRVFFITTRTQTKGMPVEEQTAYWLSDELGVRYPTVLVVSNKGDLAQALRLDAMIDDKPENLISVAERSPHTNLYLRDREWNQDADKKIVYPFSRVLSFEDFYRRMNG